MATSSKSWSSQNCVIGSDTYPTLHTFSDTEEYTDDINLESGGHEGAQVEVHADFQTSPVDDLQVNVYPSLDGSNYDDLPVFSFLIKNDVDQPQRTFIIKDLAHFRVGVVQTGSSDSTNEVGVWCKKWRWTSA